jgi:type III secretion system chaperone SycN
MWMIDESVAEFGRSLGMSDLRLRDDGGIVLGIDRIGVLAIEMIGERQEDVALSLSRAIDRPDEQACRRALELCYYRNPSRWPLHAAFAGGGQLVFAVQMESHDFVLSNIHEAIEVLTRMHDAMETFVRAR